MTYKQAIEIYEYFANGYRCLNAHSVEVLNVKVGKSTVTADVILHNDEDNVHKRINDCSYPKRFLQVRMGGRCG
jgi:hypothetical protein